MKAIHPDEAALLRWVLGELPERRRADLDLHLTRCRPCRREREATKRLHSRLSDAGDSLAFAPGDLFETRPAAGNDDVGPERAATAMAAALQRLSGAKQRLLFAIAADAPAAADELALEDAACRLAAAHVLEEAASSDPSQRSGEFAAAVAGRAVVGIGEAEAVLPAAHLGALAHLVCGNWQLYCGRPENAGVEFGAAWAALGEFDAPEHLIAWVETGESLRRSYGGRALEGRLLAERALATFENYGLRRGVLRATHARAVAIYTACDFREAHREFCAVIASKEATRLDRARGVSGAAFCLAARGRFHEAAKEYPRVRRRLRGDGAATEQYLLLGEMKACLGTAGRWRAVRCGEPAFALPEAGGAFHARGIAAEILKAASERGIDAAKERLSAIESDPARGYAVLNAAQLAMRVASADPALYVDLAQALQSSARSLPFLGDKGPAQPVCREQVQGEAQLLESNALNYLGLCAESRKVAQQARVSFVEAGEDSFALALADYVEGSAASFEGDFEPAWRLLKKALAELQLYGQEDWVGRAEAALGTLLVHRDRSESALYYFDCAVKNLHPTLDEVPYCFVLANRAGALMLLGRFDAAKATYAKALAFARRLNLKVAVLIVRYGLGSIELRKGQVFRAFHSFEKIAADAGAEGFEQRVLSAKLRSAECLGRLGKAEEMLTRVRALRREIPTVSVESDPAIRDLFALADSADLTSDLIADVVESLEARERGVQEGYKPFKLLKGGA